MLLCTLRTTLLGNLLSGKEISKASYQAKRAAFNKLWNSEILLKWTQI